MKEDVFLVPFDNKGWPSDTKATLDLSVGRRVQVTGGPYKGCVGEVKGKRWDGHYLISCKGFNIQPNAFADKELPASMTRKRNFIALFATWWLESATKGFGMLPGKYQIPLVNAAGEETTEAVVEDKEDLEAFLTYCQPEWSINNIELNKVVDKLVDIGITTEASLISAARQGTVNSKLGLKSKFEFPIMERFKMLELPELLKDVGIPAADVNKTEMGLRKIGIRDASALASATKDGTLTSKLCAVGLEQSTLDKIKTCDDKIKGGGYNKEKPSHRSPESQDDCYRYVQ